MGDDGPIFRVVECLNDSEGIVPWDGEDYFAIILKEYLAIGGAKRGTIGAAPSDLIDARDLVNFGAAWMSANLVA